MNKPSFPKLDRLRAMREAEFAKRPTPKAPVAKLRTTIDAIPASKKRKTRRKWK
jgi:hypothetical protein